MNSEPKFTWDEALKSADTALCEQTGNHLSDIEVKVLRGAWDGDSYEQIAEKLGYSVNYIRADVGSKLWEKLSFALGEEVTKKKFQEALKRESEKRLHHLIPPPPSIKNIEYPEGQVPLDSRFYVERQPIEYDCYKEILKPGSLIRIKAPNQMGKTSLMVRILAHAEANSYRTVRLNLQQAEAPVFANLDKFLRWFCANISRQLGLQPMLDDYWDEEIGSKISCTTYFQARLLEQIDSPLVIALDEVDRIFHYPDIAGDFLPLLREFHEEANNLEVWRKLRLIVTHSTEVYIPLNINRSPFNVGLPIKLPEFTEKQVQDLAKLHQLDAIGGEEVKQLMAIVGGHPFLVRLAFYHLFRQDITLEKLLSEAATQAGIYSDHLRRHLGYFQKQSELIAAMKRVVESDKSVKLESRQAYKLESMGLVKLKGDESRILAKANEEANRKIKRANISIGFGSAVLITILIVAGISWIYTWQKVKKAEQKLENLNLELNASQIDLNTRNKNAREFTVLIGGIDGRGSGVIIGRKGNTYLVLTTYDVVSSPGGYEIQTPDGERYPIYSGHLLPDANLAVLPFTSNKEYRVAELGNSDELKEGTRIYYAGYASPGLVIPQRLYYFLMASITERLPIHKNGYELAFNGVGIPGMSGGPMMDTRGRVIGISGKADINENSKKMIGVYGVAIKRFGKLRAELPFTLTPLPASSDVLLSNNNRQFFCGDSNGLPAIFVRTARGPVPIIIWTNKEYISSNWSSERRCKEISDRFEIFKRSRQLEFLKAGSINGQSVICATASRESLCSSTNVLITLAFGTNVNVVLRQLIDTRLGISTKPLFFCRDGSYCRDESKSDIPFL